MPLLRMAVASTFLTIASLANAANQTSARLYAMPEAEQFFGLTLSTHAERI